MDLGATVKEYLEGLSPAVLERLYQSPATCLAVFRLLPSLAKMLVMSMLFADSPMPVSYIDTLVRPSSGRLQVEALQKLKGLHLIVEKRREATVILNSIFTKSFRSALTTGEANRSFGVPCETEDKHKVDIAFLDQHATSKWEGILHFMVGTSSSSPPGSGVLSLLRQRGLMEPDPDAEYRGALAITSSGFQFLLQSVNSQIWTLLLQYLAMAPDLQMDPVDVLNFIFMLGSLELGKDYSLGALSDTQIKMLEDLHDFGVVYQRKSSSRRFYPTRLATTLTSDTSGLRTASSSVDVATTSADGVLKDQADSGFIILETNYRLYAYTNSPLQIAVLHLFVHLRARFPNMVTGQITRDSVRRALLNGITADQIITYLTVHAHQQMRRNDPVLPPTITDQLKLWQLERDRIRATDGFMYTNFSSIEEYNLVASYAHDLGVLVWQNPQRRRFFVTREGNAQVVEYVQRKMAR